MQDEIKYLFDIVSPLIDNPSSLKIDRKVDERGVCLLLSVDHADMGYIIGKEGKNARAIRTLLHAYGGINKKMVSLLIVEPEGSKRFNITEQTDRDILEGI